MENIKLIKLVSLLVLLVGATVGFTRYHSLNQPLPQPPSTDPNLHVVIYLSVHASTRRRVFVNGSLHAVVTSQPQLVSPLNQSLPLPSTDLKLHVVVSLSVHASTVSRVFVNRSLHAVVSSQPQLFSLSSQAHSLNQPLTQPPSSDSKLHAVVTLSVVHAFMHPHLFVNRSLHAVVSRQPQSFSFMVTLTSPPDLEMEPIVVEARTCESQSHHFKGLCLTKSNCATVCQTAEGFHGGKCQGLRRQCFCTKHC